MELHLTLLSSPAQVHFFFKGCNPKPAKRAEAAWKLAVVEKTMDGVVRQPDVALN